MHVGRWGKTRAGRMARLYPDGGLAASAGADGWRVYDADGACMAAGFESGTDAADEALERISNVGDRAFLARALDNYPR